MTKNKPKKQKKGASRLQRKKEQKKFNKRYPFVSVCTPTYNRRPFMKACFRCILEQDYPLSRIEWVVIDDGQDKIEDLIKEFRKSKPGFEIVYKSFDDKITLGKKRNIMHDNTKGDIIVYFDDDDYYPRERISHAVHSLKTHPSALCAGSSEIYVYFPHIETLYQFGPYQPKHATAGTFAFRRRLIQESRYDDNAALAEERAFLKDYSVPFVQLDPKKTILVVSHSHNTFDKKTLLNDKQDPKFCKPCPKYKVQDIYGSNEWVKEFYIDNLETKLNKYEPGKPKNKPDVIKQTEEIKIKREKMRQEKMQNMMEKTGIIVNNEQGQQINLTKHQARDLLVNYKTQCDKYVVEVKQKDTLIEELTKTKNELTEKVAKYENQIRELQKNIKW
jgi:glycosyltransferase involved in cell wall biosynthesis